MLEFGIHISQINQTLHPLNAAPTWFQTYAAAQKVAQTALTAQVTALVTAQTALTTEVATVKAQATAQAALTTTRHDELLNGLYNCNAISYNRSSTRPMSDLLPLKDTGGNIPENFPLTRENLFALSSADCQSLLTAYALPLGGNIDAKRKRLANHFGLP